MAVILSIFDTHELVARAYHGAVWRFGRPKTGLTFPDVESRQEAECLAPEVWGASSEEERQHCHAMWQLLDHEAVSWPWLGFNRSI